MLKKKVQTVIYTINTKDKKQFLLLKMNEKRNLYWQNVTGGVEESESIEDAAIRESIEETALEKNNIISLQKSKLQFSFTDQWKNNVNEFVYFLEVKDKWIVKIDPNEHCDYKWVDQEEITRESVFYESNYQAIKEIIINE